MKPGDKKKLKERLLQRFDKVLQAEADRDGFYEHVGHALGKEVDTLTAEEHGAAAEILRDARRWLERMP